MMTFEPLPLNGSVKRTHRLTHLASSVICISLYCPKKIQASKDESFLPKHTNNTDFELAAAMLVRRLGQVP